MRFAIGAIALASIGALVLPTNAYSSKSLGPHYLKRHRPFSLCTSLFVSTADNSDTKAPVTTTPIPSIAQSVTKSKPNRRRRKKKKNSPTGDINFLKKRTQHLLTITSEEENSNDNPESMDISAINMKIERNTFHWLIHAWATSGDSSAPEQAQSLLDRMEVLGESDPDLAPDVRSYTKLINAYSRSGRKDAGEKGEQILNRMLKDGGVSPNIFTYNTVLEAYANTGTQESALKAERLCNRIVNMASDDDDMKPNERSFNAVIMAWSKSGHASGALKAELYLDHMEQLYSDERIDVQPNGINYNSVITAWAKSGEDGAAQRAEEMLIRMEDMQKNGNDNLKPNVITYNACIDAWAKSYAKHAGEKAEQLLGKMESLYERGANVEVKPNTRSYNSVMNAYAKSPDGALMAEQILNKMEILFVEGNKDVRPDFFSYATVISGWGRSYEERKAEKVLALYRRMNKQYIEGNSSLRPNVVIFNAIINACAYTIGDVSEQNKAIEIASTMLKELDLSPHGKPDQVTYGTFLKVCRTQMPECPSRTQIVEVVFNKCMKEGQVGQLVLEQLQAVTTPDKFKSLVGRSHKNYMDLPRAWTRNVVEGKRRRRQRLF